MSVNPSGRNLEIDGYGIKHKHSLCSRIRQLSCKNAAIFWCINIVAHILYWRVKSTATPMLCIAAVRSRLLRPQARADLIVFATRRQPADRSLYCIASCSLPAIWKGRRDRVFHEQIHDECYINTMVMVIQTNARQWVPDIATKRLCTISLGALFGEH